MKFFNTAGPINPEKHYYIPGRFNEEELKNLIEQEKYFILHAPRQSGKTTAMLEFVKKLNQEGKFQALYVNVEPAQTARSNYEVGMKIILREIRNWGIETFVSQDPFFTCINQALKKKSESSLGTFLQSWARICEKPIVLFIDEIDSLVGDTLISVLRQLRSHYPMRPKSFPQSACLVGVRDVRDYRIWSDAQQATVLGGSAFNIKAESLTLHNFTLKQVRNLLLQHTKETGQEFTKDAIAYTFEQTQGQPWLVNALAYQACFCDVTDRKKTITLDVIQRAREALIKRQDTHLDVLISRLNEPRVVHIVDAILSGTGEDQDFKSDDIQYARDLGLISSTEFAIANPIYQEIIPRELTSSKQMAFTMETKKWYLHKDGSLNTHKLLEKFTEFYRENSEVWQERFAYKEAGPHLLLMAFLQRVVNGGGVITREYALGRGRLDILVAWPYGKSKQQRAVFELKVHRNAKTLPDGLKQTAGYMRTCNATEGHLIIFNRSSKKTWDEKIFTQQEMVGKREITVWGM